MAPTNDGAHLSSPLFAICKTDPDSQQRNPKFKIVHSDLVQELLSFEVHITKPYGSQSCRATTASIGSSSMSCTFCSLWRSRKHGEGCRTAWNFRARRLEGNLRHGAHAWRVSLRSQLQGRRADAVWLRAHQARRCCL